MVLKKNKAESDRTNKEKIFYILIKRIIWVIKRIRNLFNRKKIAEENINIVTTSIADTLKEEPEEVVVNEEIENELEKTMLYRVIPVDGEEIDDTFLEIAKHELKEAEQEAKKKAKIVNEEPEEVIEEDDSLTKINLELLKEKKGIKKSKNIIETVMLIKKEELYEILDIFMRRSKTKNRRFLLLENLICLILTIETNYYNFYM
jgi:hypothetical protein